jgi:uncharacterized protein
LCSQRIAIAKCLDDLRTPQEGLICQPTVATRVNHASILPCFRCKENGFTGHKSPDVHLQMLAAAAKHSFRFDAVQMPLNVMDAHFNSFEKKVLPILTEDGVGVLGMKPMGDPFILNSNTVNAVECLHYAMNLPTSVVITGCDSLAILRQALDAARAFRPMDSPAVAALLAKTAKAAEASQFELYKTTHHFDGTVHNPQWLG